MLVITRPHYHVACGSQFVQDAATGTAYASDCHSTVIEHPVLDPTDDVIFDDCLAGRADAVDVRRTHQRCPAAMAAMRARQSSLIVM